MRTDFALGRWLAAAVFLTSANYSSTRLTYGLFPIKNGEKRQNGGSKPPPYGFTVTVRLCTALMLSLQGYKYPRQSLLRLLQVEASVICLTSAPSPRHHNDAEGMGWRSSKLQILRPVKPSVRIAEGTCTPAMTGGCKCIPLCGGFAALVFF